MRPNPCPGTWPLARVEVLRSAPVEARIYTHMATTEHAGFTEVAKDKLRLALTSARNHALARTEQVLSTQLNALETLGLR